MLSHGYDISCFWIIAFAAFVAFMYGKACYDFSFRPFIDSGIEREDVRKEPWVLA